MFELLKKIFKTGILSESIEISETQLSDEISSYQKSIFKKFNRALAIRHVDAGSCNACELEIHALNNPYYNIEGYGIHFVSSPKHADILLATGPVTKNMEVALKRTYEVMPSPKWVIASGDCACNGGIFNKNYAICGGINQIIPVDLVIPGCPPTPQALLKGIFNVIYRSNK